MKSVINMTAEQLLAKFGPNAADQLEIGLAENGYNLDHPRWEEVFIDLDSYWVEGCCMVTTRDISGYDRVIRITG